MQTSHIIAAVVTGALCLGALVIAIFQFRQKGPIFTNAYLWATPQEREKLDKKAEYKMAATVFSVFAVLFAMCTASLVTGLGWLNYAAIGGAVLLLVYVLVKTIRTAVATK